jgi:Flp pilus assembly protein TadG
MQTSTTVANCGFAGFRSDLQLSCRETSVKTFNMRRMLSVALTGIALAAVTQVSYAASDVDVANQAQTAGLTKTAPLTPATTITESRRAGRGSPLTLYMKDASGNAFRLVHVQGMGWKYAEGWKSPDRAADSLFRKVAFWSTTPAPAPKAAVPDDEPLTVFIDGPTGFTYVWNRDAGWKFVGKIADRSP